MTTPNMLTQLKPSSIYDPRAIGTGLPCKIFKRIQVLTHPLGGNMMAWELWPGQRLPGPFHFYVDFSRAGADIGNPSDTADEWDTLNASPVINSCVYFDARRRNWDHLADYYYRVRLVLPGLLDPHGQPTVYKSQPEHAGGFLDKKDWLYAREICRKEYLAQRKGPVKTARGLLLKRKRWGTPCPTCRDFDTGEVTNGGCLVCLGTGITGGYYPPIDFNVTFMDTWRREIKYDPVVSQTQTVTRSGRAVLYPYLDTNDVFVRRDTGERWYLNRTTIAAEISGVPLVGNLELRLAPNTDIAYSIPITEPIQASSSSQSEAADGLNQPGTDWGNGHV